MVARRNLVVPRRRVRVGGCPVQTTVTARPAVVRRWLYVTLWLQRRRLRFAPGGLIVGMGVQWTPPYRKLPAGAEPRPGTLQLCVGNRCLVFQISRAGVPQILHRFLADGRVTFAAYNVESDRRKLRQHHGLEVEAAMELHGAAGMGNSSMEDMADRLLGMRIEKPKLVGASKWDGATLSREQVRYAAVDAYVSCRLGVDLRRRRRTAEAVRRQRQVYQAEYSDADESGDDDAESEGSPEQDYYRGGDWEEEGRFVERVDDDRLYDSMSSSLVY